MPYLFQGDLTSFLLLVVIVVLAITLIVKALCVLRRCCCGRSAVAPAPHSVNAGSFFSRFSFSADPRDYDKKTILRECTKSNLGKKLSTEVVNLCAHMEKISAMIVVLDASVPPNYKELILTLEDRFIQLIGCFYEMLVWVHC